MATGRDLRGHCRGGMGELRGVGQGLCSVWAGRAREEIGLKEPPPKEAWDLQTTPVAVAYLWLSEKILHPQAYCSHL